MAPAVPSLTRNVTFSPGSTIVTRKSNIISRCSILRKSGKHALPSQKCILPLSTSIRLFPQIRFGSVLKHKTRTLLVSATETDIAVEEKDLPLPQTDSGETSEAAQDAAETIEASSLKSDANSTSTRTKRSRPARKSEMPPVKNEELIPGATFTGKVRSIQPFGAFVDFGAFTDGLVHVSRLSDSFVKDVASVVSVGQEVTVKLVEADLETGRISLSMRENEDRKQQRDKDSPVSTEKSRPPRRSTQKKDDVKKTTKFVIGQELTGTVKNLIRAGAFITLPEGEEGFLPKSDEADEVLEDVMGTSSSLQVGQEINVRVLNITRSQVTLTTKSEEDTIELDPELSQGFVHKATNPFLLAFRNNKEISAFLDGTKTEEESTEGIKESDSDTGNIKDVLPESSKEEEGTAQATEDSLPETEGSSDDKELLDSTESDAPEQSIVENAEPYSETLKTGKSIDENVEPNSETSAAELSSNVADEMTDAPSTPDVPENDTLPETSGTITESFPSEKAAEEEVKEKEEEVLSQVTNNENEVEIGTPDVAEIVEDASGSSGLMAESLTSEEAEEEVDKKEEGPLNQAPDTENYVPISTSDATEKVGTIPEENGGIVRPTEEVDAPSGLEVTSAENEDAGKAVENLIENAVVNDEVEETLAADAETSSITNNPEDNVGPKDEKNDDTATSSQQDGAASETEATTKATVSPALVKQLREETGAGMMDCKKALSETGGDLVKAQEYLRKKGLASAEKKASRATAQGKIGSYIHDSRIGVLIEVNCETDFVSRGEIFKELVDDLAMQVAACPQVQYLVTEDVPQDIVEKEREIEMQKEDLLSKPEQIRSKIVDGRIRKRLEELALLEQPYIKNDKMVVKDWVKQTISTIGENIKVNRFVRYNLGEGLEKKNQDFAAEVAAQTAQKADIAPGQEQPAVPETKEVAEPPKATVSAALVKQLREETGAGMMDCKKALSETGGDLEKAQEYLRKKGLAAADKKSSRIAAEGRIGSYIHDSRIGVLIEVNCETDFVSRSENFKELVDNLAMQVVACPQVEFVSIEDIPQSIVDKEKELEMQRDDLKSKPENIREKIVEGRVSKRVGELVLLEQPFIRNDSLLVKDLVKQTVAGLGENIKVRRFVRFTLGEQVTAN